MRTVAIDPGHGGKDAGACRGIIHEAQLALLIADRVAHNVRLLSRRSAEDPEPRIQTYLTRTNDRFVGIANRPILARQAGCKMLVSIHLNAGIRIAHGAECWIDDQTYLSQRAPSADLAQNILKRLAVCTLRNRGIKLDRANRHKHLGVLEGFSAFGPAVLLEVGFISNDHDRRLLLDPASREVIAIQIAAAIVQGFGIEPRMELLAAA
jgi:N-acetylmuramoyl-L-alanine amidase